MRIDTLPEEDQYSLGQELAELAVAMGPTWLLDAPILLPRPADFPDQWRPDLAGAELMLERLLSLAGLASCPSPLRRTRTTSRCTLASQGGIAHMGPPRFLQAGAMMER